MSTLEAGVIGSCTIASLIDRRGRPVWPGPVRLDGDPACNMRLSRSWEEGLWHAS